MRARERVQWLLDHPDQIRLPEFTKLVRHMMRDETAIESNLYKQWLMLYKQGQAAGLPYPQR